jgi:hypothetical protein
MKNYSRNQNVVKFKNINNEELKTINNQDSFYYFLLIIPKKILQSNLVNLKYIKSQ